MLPFLKRNTLWQTRSKNRKEIRFQLLCTSETTFICSFCFTCFNIRGVFTIVFTIVKKGEKIRGYARMLIPLDVLNTVKKQTFSCFRKMFSYIFIFIFSQRNFIAAVFYIICIKHRFMYVVWIKSLMFDLYFCLYLF